MITMMKKIISKALMNIFLDEININEQFLNIISITGNKLKEEIQKMNENFVKLNDYPEWYPIKEILDEDINNINNFLNDKKSQFKNSYNILENDFHILDKNKIDQLINNILFDYFENEKNKFFFKEEEEQTNGKNSDAWKMIMTLIVCDLSNTSIFLQGSPGSGKSCAARHYGSHRRFKNRILILTINCHNDLTLDYLVGNYSFQNKKFRFIKGPLIKAMENGEPILLDESNLSPESIYINLLPILKANFGDSVNIKGVPYPVKINPGFLLIETGNSKLEKGRNKIPNIILEKVKIYDIKNSDINQSILEQILKNEFNEIYDLISVKQIIEIVESLTKTINFKLTFRQIKCLLDRINRFCINENSINKEKGFEKIPVIYIVISYIIPQINVGLDSTEKSLKKLDEKLDYINLQELKDFISSEVTIESVHHNDKEEDEKVIKKGKLCLKTSLKKGNLPQVILQTYF